MNFVLFTIKWSSKLVPIICAVKHYVLSYDRRGVHPIWSCALPYEPRKWVQSLWFVDHFVLALWFVVHLFLSFWFVDHMVLSLWFADNLVLILGKLKHVRCTHLL